MAERIVAVCGVAAATTQTVGTVTSLKLCPATITKQADHLTRPPTGLQLSGSRPAGQSTC